VIMSTNYGSCYCSIEKCDLFNAYINSKHMETLNANKNKFPKEGYWICCSTRKELSHDKSYTFFSRLKTLTN